MKSLRKKIIALITLILTVTIFFTCNLNAGDPATDSTQTDAEAVAADTVSLTITYGGSDNASNVTQNLTLAISGSSGTTISWSSSNTSVVANNGTVTRLAYGSGNASVTLTATIAKGTESDTKVFNLTVIEVPGTAGDQVTYTAGSVTFNMVYVPGGITFPTGTDDSVTATVTDAYEIGETEVTYELWNIVYTWATDAARGVNQYTFANVGRMGNVEDGTGMTNQHPVTMVNWRDVMIWSNALTEYFNAQNGTSLTCVYYTDAGFTAAIRTATDIESFNSTAGSEDNPYVKSDATGFRLMASNEWELAARYISDDGDNTLESGEYYPANYASGADALYNATTGGSDFDGDGDTDYTSDVAVYGGSANPTEAVKSKKPNKLGLYNMNGNVKEWSFTLNSGYRNHCGGGFSNIAGAVVVYISTTHSFPYYESESIGFRFARSVD